MRVPDFYFGVPTGAELSYDIESFPNIFTCTVKNNKLGLKWVFEISDRRSDLYDFCRFIETIKKRSVVMVGFNTMHYDYPVVHWIYNNENDWLNAEHIYEKSMSIINCDWNARFGHVIWESDWLFDQVDLFKVHHFDNKSKATSLKILEVHMEMDSVEEAPFPFGTVLDDEQKDILLDYNDHDVDATEIFLDKSRAQLDLRRELSNKYDENFVNYSDVKIGERILIIALENAGVEIYDYSSGRKEKRQTKRSSVNLGEVIFDYVQLERFEFQNIDRLISDKIISASDIEGDDDRLNTKGVFDDLTAHVDGIEYKFGTGGIHGSVSDRIVVSDEYNKIVDVDVAGYYPSLAIVNRLYPEHLGPIFCDVYDRDIVQARKKYPKKTALNEAYKLAGNGSYGGSNTPYSPLLDPKFTMTTTINGQLLLCMLIEQLIKVPGLEMIQANTDGVTYVCPREYLDHTRALQKWWEEITGLVLEEALYKRMFIRDVNSYLAVKLDDSVKRIGAYAYETPLENPYTRELGWHKDHSMRVVAMAAEAQMVRGVPVDQFVMAHRDPFDFMLSIKVPRNGRLEANGVPVQNTSRYYVSTNGAALTKILPGLKGGPERDFAVQKGWTTTIVNDADLFRWDNVNWYFYITEARKLLV